MTRPIKKLNFFPIYENILRQRRKTTTLRIGNRDHLVPGETAMLTIGWDPETALPLHTVLIARVYIRNLADLNADDLDGESPDCSTSEAAAMVVGSIYKRVLTPQDVVTVVKFRHL